MPTSRRSRKRCTSCGVRPISGTSTSTLPPRASVRARALQIDLGLAAAGRTLQYPGGVIPRAFVDLGDGHDLCARTTRAPCRAGRYGERRAGARMVATPQLPRLPDAGRSTRAAAARAPPRASVPRARLRPRRSGRRDCQPAVPAAPAVWVPAGRHGRAAPQGRPRWRATVRPVPPPVRPRAAPWATRRRSPRPADGDSNRQSSAAAASVPGRTVRCYRAPGAPALKPPARTERPRRNQPLPRWCRAFRPAPGPAPPGARRRVTPPREAGNRMACAAVHRSLPAARQGWRRCCPQLLWISLWIAAALRPARPMNQGAAANLAIY